MRHGDGEPDEERRQHGGAAVGLVHGGPEHHQHQQHRQQQLHHEPARRGRVSVDGVHAQAPLLQGGKVQYRSSWAFD